MGDNDFRGEPVKPAELTQETVKVASKASTNPWNVQNATGLTPKKLAGILAAAADGDNIEFLGLAEELEERDLHYAGQLGVLKNAIAGLEWSVTGEEGAILDACNELLKSTWWKKLVKGLLDGEAKGYAAVELIWEFGAQWTPVDVKWRDPRFFGYLGDTIMMRDLAQPSDIERFTPLPAFVFAVYETHRKEGLPYRNGVAWPCSFLHMLKSFGFKDWMVLAEIFGLPLRVGRYEDDAKEGDKAALLKAVAAMGEDASTVIPKTMEIDLIGPATGTAKVEIFESLINLVNKEMSKGILGQTMLTDDGASLSQSQVHEEVARSVQEAIAEDLATVLTRDVINAFICLNFGEAAAHGFEVKVVMDDTTDLKELSDALVPLMKGGFPVLADELYQKFGLTPPKKGDKVVVSGSEQIYEDPTDDPPPDTPPPPPPPTEEQPDED